MKLFDDGYEFVGAANFYHTCQARSDLLTQKCPGELDENCVQIEPVHRTSGSGEQ